MGTKSVEEEEAMSGSGITALSASTVHEGCQLRERPGDRPGAGRQGTPARAQLVRASPRRRAGPAVHGACRARRPKPRTWRRKPCSPHTTPSRTFARRARSEPGCSPSRGKSALVTWNGESAASRGCVWSTTRRETTAPTSNFYRRQRAERARAALEQIRPSEREAVVLRYAAELSFREVGEACGIDEAAARKRVSRALARLREALVKE